MSVIAEVVISWLLSMSTFLKTWRRSESEMRSFSLRVFTVHPAPLRSPMMYCNYATKTLRMASLLLYQELIQLHVVHLPPLRQQAL